MPPRRVWAYSLEPLPTEQVQSLLGKARHPAAEAAFRPDMK